MSAVIKRSDCITAEWRISLMLLCLKLLKLSKLKVVKFTKYVNPDVVAHLDLNCLPYFVLAHFQCDMVWTKLF